MRSPRTDGHCYIFETRVVCYTKLTLWCPVVPLCSRAAGPRGSSAQCFSAAVCLWEAEDAAGPDGGPGLRGPDGNRGHRARQAAPGISPRPLNLFYISHYLTQISSPNASLLPRFSNVLERLTIFLKCGLPNLSKLYPCYALCIFSPSLVDCLQLTPLVHFSVIRIPSNPFLIKKGFMWVPKMLWST